MGRKGYCVDPFKLHKKRVFNFIGSVSSDLAGTYALKKGAKICNNCRSRLAKVKGQPEQRQASSSPSTSSEDEISCSPSTSGAPIPETENGMSTDDEESEVTLQQVLPALHETPVKMREFIQRA
jgi:hypothetical protein